MHSVSAADLDRMLELQGAAFQHGAQILQPIDQQRGCLLQQQRLGGVHHIVGGEPVMQPARRLGVPGASHGFGHRGGEGDDIVLHQLFDFVDAWDVETGVLAQQPRGLNGDDAQFGQRFGGGELHFEPLLEAVLVAPDPAHVGTCVSGNHKKTIRSQLIPCAAKLSGNCSQVLDSWSDLG